MRGLVLPEDPLQLTIIQRTSKTIRGSDDTLSVHIDDITGGQVLVEVLRDSGPALVDTISMTPGDVVKFRVAEQEYHLTLTRLQNFLTGNDFAVFEVSTKAPLAEHIEAIRKAAQPPEVQKKPQQGDQAEHQ